MIEDKNQQLNNLSMQVVNNSKEIDLLWNQIEGVERKRETLYLLINQGALNKVVAEQYSQQLTAYIQQPINIDQTVSLVEVDKWINDYQQQIRESIDQKFFLNLALNEQEMALSMHISSLRNWSIFLQMIGLSLILARDLSRKST